MKNNTFKKTRLTEQAYDRIRTMIISLELPPGFNIIEGQLEEQLSIGRTPIRDALQRLVAENMLDSIPGRGFIVKSMSLDDVKALFETLMIFERVAVYLAAKRINKDQLKQLHTINKKRKTAMKKKDTLTVTLLNSEFHQTIFKSTQNIFIQNALTSIHDQVLRMGYLCYSEKNRSEDISKYEEDAMKDHELILKSFEEGDGEKAIDIMTEHIHRFYQQICSYIGPSIDPLSLFLHTPNIL